MHTDAMASEARRGHKNPWSWSYGLFLVPPLVSELESSRKQYAFSTAEQLSSPHFYLFLE